MKKKVNYLVISILAFILSIFFFQVFIKGFIPFPGDLLVHNYAPWKFYSYLGYIPGTYPTKNQYSDVIRQLYPWKVFVIDQLKHGVIPFWNPYSFAGSPLLANFQSQVFYPMNILYFILPFIYAWTTSLILQIVLAFLFTYLYAKKIKISTVGAILSAIGFSCSLYQSVFFEYGVFGQTILWLPFLLYGVEEVIGGLKVRSILLFVTGIVCAAFAGHLQLFVYVIVFTALYSIFRIQHFSIQNIKKIGMVFLLICLAIGIAAIQFLPSLELIQLAARANHDSITFTKNLLLQLHELIVIVSPDFYGNPASNNFLLSKSYPQTALYVGIIPFIFALTTIINKKNRYVKYYLIAAIITTIFITANPISNSIYSLPIPGIAASAPTNGIFLLSFSLSILAGIGFDNWLQHRSQHPLYMTLTALILLLAVIGVHKGLHLEFNTKSVIYSGGLLILLSILIVIARIKTKIRLLTVVFLLITIVDLSYFFLKFNPFVSPSLVYPNAPILSVIKKRAESNRVLGIGNANIPANVTVLPKLLSPEGYDPLYPKKYGELLYASHGMLYNKFDDHTRSDARIDSMSNVLDLMGVKYIIDRSENGSTEKTFPPERFTSTYNNDGWILYENKHALPHVFLTTNYVVAKTKHEFENIFFNKDFNPQDVVILAEKPGIFIKKNLINKKPVQISEYKANLVTIQASNPQNSILVLSDMYYPGWKAYVDGKETKVIQANYTVRGIAVEKGQHKISFVYEPTTFAAAKLITLLSLIVLFTISFLIFVRKLRYAA